ncbi:MAG: sulfonate transporter substrate-binding protein [Caballeronia sp.]|jgi:sulfonate transport system substrate-binding protein|uniref:NrtA/SsuA/CpmA family ABC transporter substrate-binding protein n=1 Tax=Caballeronia sp. TaxID=1931223 RepID=UPI002608A943|nr:NrtA/SsuA/CpmA family ABC transporter substrate-binding protein [Caballeronia sp.]MDB5837852.1 sulfonate transporter substrate-binding protein [Caballeronia sp.]
MSNPSSSIWSRRRFLQTTVAASALATGLAACGSRKTDTVRLGWGLGGLPMLAKVRGEFEKTLAKDNVKVEWIGPFPNHAPSLAAVTGGSADFSFGGSTTPALAAMIAGSPLVFTQFCVVDPRSTAIIAKDGSGIDRVEDLVGKTVAVNRSGLGEFLLVAALEKHKVPRDAVKFVYLNPPDAAPAFSQGKIDAWSMWSPGVDIARANYKGHNIFLEGRDLDFQIDFNSYVTTRKFAEDNADLVKAVNAAYGQEAKWASENSLEAETIAQQQGHYSDEVRNTLSSMKRKFNMHGVGDKAFVQDLQKAADWLAARSVLPQKINVSEYLAKV